MVLHSSEDFYRIAGERFDTKVTGVIGGWRIVNRRPLTSFRLAVELGMQTRRWS